jgi:hypothetical protein
MELDEEAFLDELMSLRREAAASSAPWQQADPCSAYPGAGGGGGGMMMSDLLFYGGTTEGAAADATSMDLSPFHQEPLQAPMPPAAAPPPHPHEEFNFDCLSEVCNPYRSGGGGVAVPGAEAVAVPGHKQALAALHDAMVEEETSGDLDLQGQQHYGGGGSPTFVFGGGARGESSEMPIVRGVGGPHHHRSKLHGAPSKNLMAERRRRKRLNDRLSMLRSIVPKISKVCIVCAFNLCSTPNKVCDRLSLLKPIAHAWLDRQMDRTSILGDTIDYVKELTERIKVLEEEIGASPEDLDLLNTLKDSSSCSNEMMVRNSTKVRISTFTFTCTHTLLSS